MVNRLRHEDRALIAAAVKDAEARTEARLAVVIVPVSDRYHLVPVLCAAIVALAAGGIMALAWPEIALRRAFAVEAAIFIAFSLVLDWLPLRLLLVPRHLKQSHANSLAHREFAARILAHPGRSGILFFVSLGEKYAQVLADRPLHELAGEGSFETIVTEFIRQVRAGRMPDAIAVAVQSCGQILATHRPRKEL